MAMRLLGNHDILTTATFAVRRWQEALIAQAAISAREVLTAPVRTDARLLTFVDVYRNTYQRLAM